MKSMDLLDIIGYLDTDLVDGADEPIPQKRSPILSKYVIPAVALLLALTILVWVVPGVLPDDGGLVNTGAPSSPPPSLPADDVLYVTLDINPSVESVEFEVRNNVVTAFKAYNDDGARILEDSDFYGIHISQAIPAFIERLIKEGYLTVRDDISVLLVSSRGSTQAAMEDLLDWVIEIVEGELTEKQINACVVAQPIIDAEKAEELAEIYGVSPGKIQYILNLFRFESIVFPEDTTEFTVYELFRTDMKRRVYAPKYQVGEYDEYGEKVLYSRVYEDYPAFRIPYEELPESYKKELNETYSKRDLEILFGPCVWTTMPAVVGLPENEAIALLHSRNIAVKVHYYDTYYVYGVDNSKTYKVGDCIWQSDPQGYRLRSDAAVDIYIYHPGKAKKQQS